MLHTRAEAIKNKRLNDKKRNKKLIFQILLLRKLIIKLSFFRIVIKIQKTFIILHKAHQSIQRHLRKNSHKLYF